MTPGQVLGVIPSRYGASRFPGKPLVPLLGKPMIAWVIEGAKKSKQIQRLIVATDDDRIAHVAESCGVTAVMTEPSLPSGSDRVWAVAKDLAYDIVINIQGDEPLLTGAELDELVEAFREPRLDMATLGRKMKNPEDFSNPNVAKVVTNRYGEALYFSRAGIPFSKSGNMEESLSQCLKHVGLYGFRKPFLSEFCSQKPVGLEKVEGLEQLRALWLGARIKVVETQYESWGVDNKEDIEVVEKILMGRSR